MGPVRPASALSISEIAPMVVHTIHMDSVDGPTPPYATTLSPGQGHGELDRDQATLYYPHQRVLGDAGTTDLLKGLLMLVPNNTHTPGCRAWMPALPLRQCSHPRDNGRGWLSLHEKAGRGFFVVWTSTERKEPCPKR
jgi:hypothetical protein